MDKSICLYDLKKTQILEKKLEIMEKRNMQLRHKKGSTQVTYMGACKDVRIVHDSVE